MPEASEAPKATCDREVAGKGDWHSQRTYYLTTFFMFVFLDVAIALIGSSKFAISLHNIALWFDAI